MVDETNEFMAWSENIRKLHGKLFTKAKNFLIHDCIHYIGDMHEFVDEGRAYIVLPLNTLETYDHKGVLFNKKPFSSDMTKRAHIITITYDKFLKINFLRCSCQGWDSKQKKKEGDLCGVQCSHTLSLKLYWKRKAFERKINGGI